MIRLERRLGIACIARRVYALREWVLLKTGKAPFVPPDISAMVFRPICAYPCRVCGGGRENTVEKNPEILGTDLEGWNLTFQPESGSGVTIGPGEFIGRFPGLPVANPPAQPWGIGAWQIETINSTRSP